MEYWEGLVPCEGGVILISLPETLLNFKMIVIQREGGYISPFQGRLWPSLAGMCLSNQDSG